MRYLDQLPKDDLVSLLAISNNAKIAKNLTELKNCILKLKSIVLFEGALSIYVNKSDSGHHNCPDSLFHIVDFPNNFFRKYIEGRYHERNAVTKNTLSKWQPQNWKTAWEMEIEGNGVCSMQLAMDFGYFDGWACSNYYQNNDCLSVFAFAGKKVEKDRRTTAILRYITPHLEEVLKAIFDADLQNFKTEKRIRLTERELEVLKWVEQGKSTWEVSVILNRSERVVKWHIENLMRKLSAQNRTHAVAKAIRQGLLD